MGIEPIKDSLTNRARRDEGGAESGALPPDLAELMVAWKVLPDAIKAAIMTLARTTRSN